MKKLLLSASLLLALLGSAARAAEEAAPARAWHATTLWEAIAYMIVFAAFGLAAAIVGYKVFDKCTPGDLNKEILEHRNIAAAIIGAAVILGVCIIIAAAMIG
ncbi:MAG: DUF350 domain-containing protein [Verrucomicrobia bacterium]|nr:DUF350 domain-containing protein [Verrucomicrobiota bacterium]